MARRIQVLPLRNNMGGEEITHDLQRKRLRLPLSKNEREQKTGFSDKTEALLTKANTEDQTKNQANLPMTPVRSKKKRRMNENRSNAEKNGGSHVLLNFSLDSSDAESMKLPQNHSKNVEIGFVSDESIQDDGIIMNNTMQSESTHRGTLVSTPSLGNSSLEGGFTNECIGKNACDFKRIMQSPSTRVSRIRIGEEFQCINIPVAGSYLADTSDPIVEIEQVWDHERASKTGCIEFLERLSPKENLEIAMDLLSKNGYRHSGLINKLRSLPPNDGSDWTVDERHRFHLLFDQMGHNLKNVAIAMGKTVLSCTLFHFGDGQKRQTRRSRTSSAAQPMRVKNYPLPGILTANEKSTKRMSTTDVLRRRTRISSATQPTSGKNLSLSRNLTAQQISVTRNNQKQCNWDYYISELKKYKKEYGHTLVPKVYPLNQPLSSWVFKVRGLYRKSRGSGKNTSSYLTDAKLNELHEVGFSFAAKHTQEQAIIENSKRVLRQEAEWTKYYSELCEFKNTHGHTIVPKRFVENTPLSTWVFKQRHHYALMKKGKINRLNDDRIRKLNAIGFVWVAKKDDKWKELEHERIVSTYDDSWEKMYQVLLKFKKKNGHTIVPKIYPENQQLASFVFCQRNQFRLRETGQTNTLTDARLDKLNRIDFAFSVRKTRKS